MSGSRTGEDITAALDLVDRLLAMVEDPDLHSDRLLLGVALLAEFEQRRRAGRTPQARMDRKRNAWGAARDRIINPDHAWAGHRDHFLKRALSNDVPRYEVPRMLALHCCGHMLRPAGAPCSKSGRSMQTTIPDPETGARSWLGSCSNPRHREEFKEIREAAVQAWRDAGEPRPAHNAGGILARYFDCDWEAVYDWARPYRDRDDAPAGKPPTPPRPRLTLVPQPARDGDA